MSGALVPSYAGAPDYQTAIRRAIAALAEIHFRFEDVDGSAREIPVDRWDDYVAKVWPEFAQRLPTAAELPALIAKGEVFFGPIAGF